MNNALHHLEHSSFIISPALLESTTKKVETKTLPSVAAEQVPAKTKLVTMPIAYPAITGQKAGSMNSTACDWWKMSTNIEEATWSACLRLMGNLITALPSTQEHPERKIPRDSWFQLAKTGWASSRAFPYVLTRSTLKGQGHLGGSFWYMDSARPRPHGNESNINGLISAHKEADHFSYRYSSNRRKSNMVKFEDTSILGWKSKSKV